MRESLAALQERLAHIEQCTGSVECGESETVLKKLQALSNEIRRMCRDGTTCSKMVWQLLDTYGDKSGNQLSQNQIIELETCQDSLADILRQLQELEFWYRDEDLDHALSCGILDSSLAGGRLKLSELPRQFAQVSRLIIGTMNLLQRFVDFNVRNNNFWNDTERRVRLLEAAIRAQEDSRAV
ncbi:LAFA_0A07536g1_1 [Lachancea sp. 'fantastica']|nr:LAFA_0A07536g1_1 [Lachancea sp. 'fantastica']